MKQVYKRYCHVILLKYPHSRNSYELFLQKYIDFFYKGDYAYMLQNISIVSLLRAYRSVQNDDKKFMPSPEVKEARKKKQRLYEKKAYIS